MPHEVDQATGPALDFRPTQSMEPAPLSPLAFPAGTRVGKYEIIRVLGRGGMGQVYLARDVVLGRRVAIKFMLDARASFIERFHAEARATARCQHENIVVIHEIGDYHGHGFMVLEYLEGDMLKDIMDLGAQPPQRALELLVPVARALSHAHAHGLVHRDLKPENVFVTVDGSVKVLDFGIARAFDAPVTVATSRSKRATWPGAIVGTPMYMAPEQHRGDDVDHRADVWAFGLILHELLVGRHPLGPDPTHEEIAALRDSSVPLPSVRTVDAAVPEDLAAIVDRCLAKEPANRYDSVQELLEDLTAIGPAKRARSEDRSPYPGLAAFGDADADVYFGRDSDVRRGLARLREQPMLGVVGPSGVGKSSFVRAGLASVLGAGGAWSVLSSRPGRDAMRSLAALAIEASGEPLDEVETIERLRAEPGYLAEILRARARRTRSQILLLVDQFEELYTLVPAIEDRAAYAACLVAIADDVAAPLRVVIAMRSDFLDRIAESADLTTALSRSLMFLSPLDRQGLREALVHPAKTAEFEFESTEVVEDILDALEHAPAALPLLQFVASKMWDARDRGKRELTAAAYRAMGGVTGAIAAHADQVVADLSSSGQREVRALFQRLVTPERTRAIVELRELAVDGALIDTLVRARLLVMSGEGDERTVEIIHDSLIVGWPKLAGWIEEDKEVVAFASELRVAAKQWDDRGRPVGLLWRGEVLALARRLRARLEERSAMSDRERAFLDGAIALDERALRVRRRVMMIALAILAAIAAGATIAMLSIRSAEREARLHAERARDEANATLAERDRADRAAERARLAEAQQTAEAGKRQAAEAQVVVAANVVQAKDRDLVAANQRLESVNQQLAGALEDQRREATRAKAAQTKAEEAARRAEDSEAEVKRKQAALQALLAEREANVKKLEEQLRKISVDLK